MLHMYDSYGDGWNGAYLEVTTNGVPSGNFDCAASYTLDSVFSFTGASMDFIFHSGNWDSEITFTILDPMGDTLVSGPAPSDLDNLLHTSNSTCPSTFNCINPSNLNAFNITTNSADVSWSAGANETSWNLQWGNSGFTVGSGNTTYGLTSTNSSLTGLSTNVSYDFYVQAVCDTTGTSIWSGPFTFTTVYVPGSCGIFSIELYDSYGDGWNGGFVDIEINSVVTQSITMANGSGPELTTFPVDSGDIVNFIYTAGNWPEENSYIIYDQNNNVLSNQTGSGANGPPSTYGLIACASCLPPINLGTNTVTVNSALIDWISASSGGGTWNVEWGVSGFNSGSGNFVGNLTTNSYFLSGLNSFTSYDFYVQEVCSSTDVSTWTGPFSFMTLGVPGTCGMYTVALYDTYGDGWQGGYLEVEINNILVQTITLQNGSGPETFDLPVDSGDVMDLIYTDGAWPEENFYEVYDQNGILLILQVDSSGSGPASTLGLEACPSVSSSFCGVYTLSVYDPYGNGWNNGDIDIMVNNQYKGTSTLISGFGPDLTSISVDSGDVIDLVYNPPVPYTLNSYGDGYQLIDHNGTLIIEEISSDSLGPNSTYGIVACAIPQNMAENIDQDVLIFPNPCDAYFNLESNYALDQVIIQDLLGRILLKESSLDIEKLDVSQLPPNMYFVTVISRGEKFTAKIIIQRD